MSTKPDATKGPRTSASFRRLIDSPIEPLNNVSPSGSAQADYDSFSNDIHPPTLRSSRSLQLATRRIQIIYWSQIVVSIVLIVLIILFFVYYQNILQWMESYITLIQARGILFAALWYMITCYVCICLLIPQTLLCLFGGFVFVKIFELEGFLLSVVAIWFGCCLGAIHSFLSARYLYRRCECVANLLQTFTDYQQIYDAVKMRANNQKYGYRLMCIMRVIPWTPYNIFNLSMATTQIKFIQFAFGLLAMIPDTFLYCFVGSFIESMTRMIYKHSEWIESLVILMITLTGSIASIALIIYIGKIAYNQYSAILETVASEKQQLFPDLHNVEHVDRSGPIEEISLHSNVSDLLPA